jgi:DNA-directed RNA polymerase specialized sigma24 family protein
VSYRFPSDLVEFLLPLLRRIGAPGDRGFARLTGSLIEEWRWVARERCFPTSKLREACRLFVLEEALPEPARLLFYRASADAMLSVLKDLGPTPEARALGRRLDKILGGLDEEAAMVLRLACLHGLKAELVGNLMPGCDIAEAGARLEDCLKDVESALRDLLLVPKGHFTTDGERVRDGKQHPMAAMGVLLPEMKQVARQTLRRQTRYVSLTAEDMAAAACLHPPAEFPLNSRQALAYVRKVFRNLLRDYFDKRNPRGTRVEFDEREHPQDGAQVSEVVYGEVLQLVAEAVREVSGRYPEDPKLSAFLFARVRQDDSLPKLARTYGLKESTARNRVAEFQDIVRDGLGRSGR